LMRSGMSLVMAGLPQFGGLCLTGLKASTEGWAWRSPVRKNQIASALCLFYKLCRVSLFQIRG